MHARRGQPEPVVLSGARLAWLTVVVVMAAACAGAFGHLAWEQSKGRSALAAVEAISAPQGAGPDVRLGGAVVAQVDQPIDGHREAAYARQNIALLAQRVGALQAKAVELEGTTSRLVQEAALAARATPAAVDVVAPGSGAPAPGAPGVAGTASGTPVLLAGGKAYATDLPALSDPTAAALAVDMPSAEDLGREVDGLQRQLAAQQDTVNTLDVAFSQQAGERARWPSLTPVSDYPYLSSSYGWRHHPLTGRYTMHEGLDFAAPRGTAIKAAASGIVVEAGFVNGYGNMVEIDHGGGLITRYAHASRLHVKQGDMVERGQEVADVGSTGRSTGPHLHFEVRLAGQPLDPRLFLGDQSPVAGATMARAQSGGTVSQ